MRPRKCSGRPASRRRGRAQLREGVGHLERRSARRRAPCSTRASACSAVSQVSSAERDGDAGLDPRELEPARRLARDEVEVRRLAADHAAERDHAGVAPRLRERHRRERELERARHGHDENASRATPASSSSASARVEQPVRDLAVEAADDDRDGAPVPVRSALEHARSRRDAKLAGRVLGSPQLPAPAVASSGSPDRAAALRALGLAGRLCAAPARSSSSSAPPRARSRARLDAGASGSSALTATSPAVRRRLGHAAAAVAPRDQSRSGQSL